MLKSIMIAGLALATVLPAAAQEVRTTEVHYADLDLTRAEGKAALKSRIRAVLPQVCGERGGAPLATEIEINQCRATAMADARLKMNQAVARAQARATIASR